MLPRLGRFGLAQWPTVPAKPWSYTVSPAIAPPPTSIKCAEGAREEQAALTSLEPVAAPLVDADNSYRRAFCHVLAGKEHSRGAPGDRSTIVPWLDGKPAGIGRNSVGGNADAMTAGHYKIADECTCQRWAAFSRLIVLNTRLVGVFLAGEL